MNKSALALAGLGFAAGIVLVVVVEPLLAPAIVTQPTIPQTHPAPPPSQASAAAAVPTLNDSEATNSGTLFQYAKWGMSPAELEKIGAGNITRTSPDRLFPNDYRQNGSRGTALDVDAEILLESGYNANGISYDAIYYFNSNRLFLVTLVPHSIENVSKRAGCWMASTVHRKRQSCRAAIWAQRAASSERGGDRHARET